MKTNAKIYVLESADGLVKVGHSRDVEKRIKSIYGRQVTGIAHLTPVKEQAELIERTAHRLLRLAGKRVQGEWFSATVAEAIDAIERAERIAHGLELDLARVPPVRSTPTGILIGIRCDGRFLEALDRIRTASKPELTRADMVRKLVYDEEKRLERRK